MQIIIIFLLYYELAQKVRKKKDNPFQRSIVRKYGNHNFILHSTLWVVWYSLHEILWLCTRWLQWLIMGSKKILSSFKHSTPWVFRGLQDKTHHLWAEVRWQRSGGGIKERAVFISSCEFIQQMSMESSKQSWVKKTWKCSLGCCSVEILCLQGVCLYLHGCTLLVYL